MGMAADSKKLLCAVIALLAAGPGGARNLVAVGAATLPTTLPIKGTRAIDYGYRGYTGTIPTEFGLLTKVTAVKLMQNDLTGAIPTQLGQLDHTSSAFDLSWNSLSSAIPTQLGLLRQMSSYFYLSSNLLSLKIPTQLGQLRQMGSAFWLGSNSLSLAIPTQLGQLSQMGFDFRLYANLLSSTIPTELGNLVQMSSLFSLRSNSFSMAIPTELGRLVQMSSIFTLGSNLLSSAIPTQLGQLDQMKTEFYLSSNSLSSEIPTQLGQLDQMSSGFYLSSNLLSSTIPTQLGQLIQMSKYFSLLSNLLSSAIPTQLGQLNEMGFGFWLGSNSLCGDLPTELASLSSDLMDITQDNFIGSPCLPSSSTDDNGGPNNVDGGPNNTQSSSTTATIWALGSVVIAVMMLGALICYRYATRTKSRAANDDDNESTASNIIAAPLLDDSDVRDTLDLESISSTVVESDGTGRGLQLQPLLPDQPDRLAHAWQSSSAQLVVLDHELRVVLWSKGMAKAMSSFTPAQGTPIDELLFPSVDTQQRTVSALELIMRETGAEDEAALHPTVALQAAVTTAPNVTLHLVTPLSKGVPKEVLLSMTAIKIKPLSATTALPHDVDTAPCHLLIMGLETFDPGLASLSHESNLVSSSSTVSDLTSENETTGEMTTSSGTWGYQGDDDSESELLQVGAMVVTAHGIGKIVAIKDGEDLPS